MAYLLCHQEVDRQRRGKDRRAREESLPAGRQAVRLEDTLAQAFAAAGAAFFGNLIKDDSIFLGGGLS